MSSDHEGYQDLPTERHFPVKMPPRSQADDFARVLGLLAVILAIALHYADYKNRVEDTKRSRAYCVRLQRDTLVELAAWRDLEITGYEGIPTQVNRLRSITRRDCTKRYPEPQFIF